VTVKELIEALEKLPPNEIVFCEVYTVGGAELEIVTKVEVEYENGKLIGVRILA
jgi:hypothetical protein